MRSHCFPGLDGRRPPPPLREGWTGVGPAIVNNNPFTWISRADWLLNYGYFSPACRRGPVSYIPPQNSAYPTAVLQALGSNLPGLLQMDHHLQARLLADGGRLFLEPSAQSEHTNLSRPLAHWLSQFHGSRLYGATRAAFYSWSAPCRWIHAAAFPVSAVLRLTRASAGLNDWRALPILLPL